MEPDFSWNKEVKLSLDSCGPFWLHKEVEYRGVGAEKEDWEKES